MKLSPLTKTLVFFVILLWMCWVTIRAQNEIEITQLAYKKGFSGVISALDVVRGGIRFKLKNQNQEYVVHAHHYDEKGYAAGEIADVAKVGDSISFIPIRKYGEYIDLVKGDAIIQFSYDEPYKSYSTIKFPELFSFFRKVSNH